MKPLMMCQDLLDDATATQVGRSIEVRPLEAPETVIRVQGPDQRTQMLTATMGIEQVAVPLGGGVGVRAATALIRWGAGGAQLFAEADFVQGAVVSVPASYLEILARNDGVVAMRVSATMGYGPRACGGPTLFRTVAYGSLATGTPVTRAVPAWATSGTVLFGSDIDELKIEILDLEDEPMITGDDIPAGTVIPMLNGVASIRLTAVVGGGKAFIHYALAL